MNTNKLKFVGEEDRVFFLFSESCWYSVLFFLDNIVVFPGLSDVHMHFRKPGFSYETPVAAEVPSGMYLSRKMAAVVCDGKTMDPSI